MALTLALDSAGIIQGAFYVLLLLFSVYGVFLGYHWFTFGTNRATSMLALAVYLLGGAVLFLTLASSI